MVVIGILSAMTIPMVTSITNKSKRMATERLLQTVNDFEMYFRIYRTIPDKGYRYVHNDLSVDAEVDDETIKVDALYYDLVVLPSPSYAEQWCWRWWLAKS